MTIFHIHELTIDITGTGWGTDYDREEAEQMLARALIELGDADFLTLSSDKMAIDAFIATSILEIKDELNLDLSDGALKLQKIEPTS